MYVCVFHMRAYMYVFVRMHARICVCVGVGVGEIYRQTHEDDGLYTCRFERVHVYRALVQYGKR